MILDLALVGFGNVGRRFVGLLEERREVLRRDHGIEWRVVGVATRRHGSSLDPSGLDPGNLLRGHFAGERARDDSRGGEGRADGVALIEAAASASRAAGHPLVVVETTVLDIAGGQPAIDHVQAALRAGAHLVTANKGPVAFAFHELRAMAEEAGRQFLFEGAVMDGIPIFNLAARTLPGVRIHGFRGVVNSTTNYIITAMENGREFTEALAEMQAAGIAEADASLDVDGWDAAAKAAALANVLLDARTTPREVERTGVGHLTGEAVRAAAARGGRIKLVARARRAGQSVRVTVGPEELPGDDLLAGLRGQQNAVVFETDLLEDLAVVQLGGGLTQTAYALVSDLVAVRRALPAPRGASSRRSPAPHGPRRS